MESSLFTNLSRASRASNASLRRLNTGKAKHAEFGSSNASTRKTFVLGSHQRRLLLARGRAGCKPADQPASGSMLYWPTLSQMGGLRWPPHEHKPRRSRFSFVTVASRRTARGERNSFTEAQCERPGRPVQGIRSCTTARNYFSGERKATADEEWTARSSSRPALASAWRHAGIKEIYKPRRPNHPRHSAVACGHGTISSSAEYCSMSSFRLAD